MEVDEYSPTSSSSSSSYDRGRTVYKATDVVLQMMKRGRNSQEKYAELRKLEEEARQKMHEADKLRRELDRMHNPYNNERAVTEKAPFNAKRKYK